MGAAAAIPARLGVAIVGAPPGGWNMGAIMLREVAITLIEALRELGHDCVPCHYQRPDGRRLIVLNPNLIGFHDLAPPPPDAVLYNFEHFEQVNDAKGWFTSRGLEMFRRFVVWDFNADNAEALRRLGIERARHVPLGSVPSLCEIPRATEDLAVLFIGEPHEHRFRVIRELKRAGFRALACPKIAGDFCYGLRRQSLIARAAIHLNLHNNRPGHFEAVRVGYLLANRRFVISEPSTSEPWPGGYVVARRAEMVDACRTYLARRDLREEVAARGHALFMADRMSAHLRNALADIGIESNEPATLPVAPCATELDYVLSESGVPIDCSHADGSPADWHSPQRAWTGMAWTGALTPLRLEPAAPRPEPDAQAAE